MHGFRNYVLDKRAPALPGLLDAAAAAGDIRAGMEACEAEARRMVALLFDGLRVGAKGNANAG